MRNQTLARLFAPAFVTALVFALSITAPVGVQAANRCETLFALSLPTRSLANVSELKVMAYNVENLFLHLGKFERMSDEKFKRMTDAEIKPAAELVKIAKAISDSDPDFIVMEEVEGEAAIQRFSEQYLNDRYVAHLTEGNDNRGIQIGFLVKRDLPLETSIESHKDMTWNDPETHKTKRLFSRDAPALMVRRKGQPQSAPLLIFIGNHAKSQRDRGHDLNSVQLRTAQYEGVGQIIDGYQAKYGKNIPIMVGGDFNIDVRKAPDVAAIRRRMKDPFDLKQVQGADRITHTYHPRNGEPEYRQLDAIFITPSLAGSIDDARVYRYKDENGQDKPIPTSYDERAQNPSDHFPVVIRFSTENIFAEAWAQKPRRAGGG